MPPQRQQAKDSELEEWEPKRIVRPEGMSEWGIPPTGPGGNRLEVEVCLTLLAAAGQSPLISIGGGHIEGRGSKYIYGR